MVDELRSYVAGLFNTHLSINRVWWSKNVARVTEILLPPLLAFLLARMLLSGVAVGAGFSPLDPSSWVRYDSKHYLAIAQDGYTFFHCRRVYFPDHWCGNVNWMPGYPWMIHGLVPLGLSGATAGLLLSATFSLLSLLLLWVLFLDARWNRENALCLLLAAFFPGYVYYHAVFPVSAFCCCALVFLWALRKERWWWAGLAGAAGAFTYVPGFLLAIVGFGRVVMDRRFLPWPTILMRLIAVSGIPLSGFAAVLFLHQRAVGVWNAFFKVHTRFGEGIQNPIPVFLGAVKPLFFGPWDKSHMPQALQALFLAVVVVMVLSIWKRRREQISLHAVVLVLYTFLFWFFPLLVGHRSLYRSQAVLLPSVLLICFLPPKIQASFVAVAIMLSVPMAALFFRSVLW